MQTLEWFTSSVLPIINTKTEPWEQNPVILLQTDPDFIDCEKKHDLQNLVKSLVMFYLQQA